ncbi:MAG: beta strand repeat-containing protein, partial [Terrimicrobiaceae bacterium]
SSGLPAGTYTLLPARYALLEGGVLVTPRSSSAKGGNSRTSIVQPEGAIVVSGYRFNNLNSQQTAPAQAVRFEVAPSSVVRARAKYEDYFANTFIVETALDLGAVVPRLPQDSGRVVFSGLNGVRIDGNVLGKALPGGFDAEIDISTQSDILITNGGGAAHAGVSVLDAARLSSFGAESILIGGLRQTSETGTTITVNTSRLTVDNAGSPLTGPEFILVAKSRLTLNPGAAISQSGTTRGGFIQNSLPIQIGDSATTGSGNGLLVRVSDVQLPIVRSGMSTQAAQAALATPPILSIGAGASISGDSLVLDSSYGTQLDPTARIIGRDVALNSGQISLQFDNPGVVPQIAGLMLSGPALQGLQSSQKLSLLSYSSLDLYGNGVFQNSRTLALHAGRIRGFNTGGGSVVFSSPEIILDNSSGGTSSAAAGGNSGQLVFSSGILRLGTGSVAVDQFNSVSLLTTGGLIAQATGSLSVPGALTITGPVLTATRAAYSVTAAGAVNISSSGGTADGRIVPGLGASLSFTGSSVLVNTGIRLPSGTLSLRATAGDLIVGNSAASVLDVGGSLQTFNDLFRYTDGGRIQLAADAGSLVLGGLSRLVVAAQAGGGNAGTVSISTPNGTFALNGSLDGRGGAGGESGSFLLDVNAQPDLTALNQSLNAASFGQLRSIRVRSGDVTLSSLATSRYFELSADQGSILVTGSGLIDASGVTGGEIRLAAFGSVTLQSGARLTVAGQTFDSAGKGGAISLEAGSQRNGVVGTGSVDIQTGSIVDLSVASKVSINPSTDAVTPGTSAYQGQFSGKLHLRAPQNVAGTDLRVNPINGTILGASSILVEGYRLFDLTNISSGVITNSGTINAAGGLMTAANNIQGSINANAQNFLGAAGVTTAGYTAMLNRLLGADPQGLLPVFVLAPGAEIIHRTGNLALGTSASSETSDWNLATFRYGAKRAPGVLTLRSFGNLNFFNALSDGFTTDGTLPIAERLFRAELTAQNPLLPINTQSWSYRLAAGADLSAADFQRVRPLASLAANSGSLQLGKVVVSNGGNPVSNTSTSAALAGRYQVIRTGSGDIRIFAARNVQLLNQFATIYTAGTRTADPTLGGNFEVPLSVTLTDQGTLGAVQQDPTYAAQYSLAGGSVLVSAGQDILHQTQVGGVLVADSQKQIPNNWLYRRGYVDPNTGQFANAIEDGFGGRSIASTSWWVDFSNFFQGIGALGGGHVTMLAGNDISNVDAVAPTNARMTYRTTSGDRLVANQFLLELGGGDVTVKAGRNLDAGIYYVERGRGILSAGGSIITNRTRTASIGSLGTGAATDFNPSSAQWLPTTLFLGKGSFRVAAGGDLRLGPVVNPFLLPVGLNNSFWRKSYFSTYLPTSEVSVTSLSGSITLSQWASLNSTGSAPAAAPILQLWMNAVHRNATGTVAARQPWLRLAEAGTTLSPFATVFTLSPGTVRATAYTGDLNLVGRFNLAPSPTGTIELAAGGSINALQPTGIYRPTATTRRTSWASATINLSDANPA